MKKAQAAMEFLMTYGWAILVVLAAIGALAYFGVLSPDRFLPSKCVVTGGFTCTEYKLDGTTGAEEVRLYLQNNLGVAADSVNVTLEDADGTLCTTTDGSEIVGVLTNGEKSSAITFDGGCTLTGTSFKGDIEIVYVKAGETESHIATGSVSGKFE